MFPGTCNTTPYNLAYPKKADSSSETSLATLTITQHPATRLIPLHLAHNVGVITHVTPAQERCLLGRRGGRTDGRIQGAAKFKGEKLTFREFNKFSVTEPNASKLNN
jgi:hypothetical protein